MKRYTRLLLLGLLVAFALRVHRLGDQSLSEKSCCPND
jgi:hypothetical protein